MTWHPMHEPRFTPNRHTPKTEPFKPGDEVQFKVVTLAGVGYFLGQIWSLAPANTTYWVATDSGVFHKVRREDLRLVAERSVHSPELAQRDGREHHADFLVEVA